MNNSTKSAAPDSLLFVGLDVHKDSIAVALAEEGSKGEVRSYGSISGDLQALEKLLLKLRNSEGRKKEQLRVVYEAGPCGYVIVRRLQQMGIECIVVAPSKIPKKSGDRVKTDKRDALNLARLHRAGDLVGITIPDAADEAIRDLCRARTDAVNDLRRTRCQLKAFLLRHGYKYSGKTSWPLAHRTFLRDLVFSDPTHKSLMEECLLGVDQAEARVTRLTELLEASYLHWARRPWCDAIMALRGISVLTSVILVAEIGDITRFTHPRQLMTYLGLTPSEYSSGGSIRQGGITKCGNSHARTMLIESAQHYAQPPNVGRDLSARQAGLSARICEISLNAQTRLNARFWALSSRGKCRQKAITAVARELLGFIWAILKEHRTPGSLAKRPAKRPVRHYHLDRRTTAVPVGAKD